MENNWRTVSFLAATGLLLAFVAMPAFAQEKADSTSEKAQIEQLRQRVNELERKLQNLKESNTETTKSDSMVAAAQQAALAATGAALPGATSQQSRSSLRQSTSQGMNPNMSAIGTFLGTGSGFEPLERNYDAGLQEAEFAFKAVVDPYATADFYIAAGRHADPMLLPEDHEHEVEAGEEEHGEEEHGHGEAGLEFELEEAYVTLLHLPLSTQLKAGKFRAKFGKINETHPHAYHYLDLPLMYQYFLGGEGLIDQGVSFRWLLPNPSFFQELTFQILSGPAESFSFTRAENNRLLYLGHLKNFFDLNDNTTLELGLLAATGPNDAAEFRTNLFAADLTLKWKPLQRNRYRSFEWSSEFLLSKRKEAGEEISSIGWFSHLRYQAAKRWYLGGLVESSEFPEFDTLSHKAYSGIVQFYATEFQKFEIQGRYNDGNYFENFFDVLVRAVFVIGAHGAHQY